MKTLSLGLLLGLSSVVVAAACGANPSASGGKSDLDGIDGGAGEPGASGGTGNMPSIDVDSGLGGAMDPCSGADAHPDCGNLEPSGPACGDGAINQDSEACDDGNGLPGDGCSGQCNVENYWDCSDPGQPCVSNISCGDGVLDPGEFCDDFNNDEGDGCSGDCIYVDPSYVCATPGDPCILLYECGDGRVNGSEECDDKNAEPEDGCDSSCKLEDGYTCSKPGQPCVMLPVCGDGQKAATEGCDDFNTDSGDGCSSLCKQEAYHVCPTPGQLCTPLFVCGNGVIEIGEFCDDFNTTPDDGCSSDCLTQDPSYVCPEGEDCILLYDCGDGRVNGTEECDDENDVADDGCNNSCELADGYVCSPPGTPCKLITFCGDGDVQAGEQCDDGGGATPVGDDGCSAQCKTEADWSCPPGGGACTYTVECGDGVISGDELCDDGGTDDGDGCSFDCLTLEDGYDCARPGFACRTVCGDGFIRGSEQCDDGDEPPTNGDGCGATCRLEEGKKCSGEPSVCSNAVCGNSSEEGLEQCDDGNGDWLDGCAPDCKKAPNCSAGACTSTCGDGIKLPGSSEECDDGNEDPGDGCDGDCKVEPGYDCDEPAPEGSLVLPIVYRDFVGWCPSTYPSGTNDSCDNDLAGNPVGHPDFEIQPAESPGRQIDDTVLDDLVSGKPVNAYGAGYNTPAYANGYTSGEDMFYWWYRDNTLYNKTVVSTLTLDELVAQPGTFQFTDGTFFPLDPSDPLNLPNWIDDGEEKLRGSTPHNFYFTSEVRYWFQYKPDADASNNPVLTFDGDDDVWVFIKNKLTVDVGGIHGGFDESVTINDNGTVTVHPFDDPNIGGTPADFAIDLGLLANNVYEIVVFQAERHTNASTYQLTLEGFAGGRSVCTPVCGVNPPVVTPDEECDDGTANTTGYGKCNDCKLDQYCGDGDPNGPEECDNGVNNSGWGDTSQNACAPGCVDPPLCGDGELNPPNEACDLGGGNTLSGYNGCKTDCTVGPYCGDGDPTNGETCDDGVNDGFYGSCDPDCTPAPKCGDGVVDEEWGEQCDDNTAGCVNCRLGAQCGNTQTDDGEECDDGINDGGYGECGPLCTLGPGCGDGIVQAGYEDCDDGEDQNTGEYGQCDEFCSYGPYCGDGDPNGTETCDDGVNDGFYQGCEADCTPAAFCGDSVTQEEWGEQCDDAVDDNCLNCRLGATCGNSYVEEENGEQCDDGVNDGGYGECGPQCTYGPSCGDGVVQSAYEQCDDGDENTGGYGKCAPGCVYGPYCGDGKLQGQYEQCDDKNNNNSDGCSSACKNEVGPK